MAETTRARSVAAVQRAIEDLGWLLDCDMPRDPYGPKRGPAPACCCGESPFEAAGGPTPAERRKARKVDPCPTRRYRAAKKAMRVLFPKVRR